MDTYLESAQGQMISARRAIQEIKSHGFTGELGVQCLAEFMAENGLEAPSDREADWCDAGELLAYLGY